MANRLGGIEQIESAVATIEIEIAWILAAIDKLKKERKEKKKNEMPKM